jgi:hypothetical protein
MAYSSRLRRVSLRLQENEYEIHAYHPFVHGIDCHNRGDRAGRRRSWSSECADHRRADADTTAGTSFADRTPEGLSAHVGTSLDEIATPRSRFANHGGALRGWLALRVSVLNRSAPTEWFAVCPPHRLVLGGGTPVAWGY